MTALQAIAMGLVILLVRVPADGPYDVVADPLGWLLVALGTARLTDVGRRGALLALAAVGTVAATALWFPGVRDPLVGGDPALLWAANLPQLVYVVTLAWTLREHARDDGDVRASRWLRTAAVAYAVVGLAPAVVFGGGVTVLADATYVGAGLTLVLVIVLLFTYARRPWVPEAPPAPDAT